MANIAENLDGSPVLTLPTVRMVKMICICRALLTPIQPSFALTWYEMGMQEISFSVVMSTDLPSSCSISFIKSQYFSRESFILSYT